MDPARIRGGALLKLQPKIVTLSMSTPATRAMASWKTPWPRPCLPCSWSAGLDDVQLAAIIIRAADDERERRQAGRRRRGRRGRRRRDRLGIRVGLNDGRPRGEASMVLERASDRATTRVPALSSARSGVGFGVGIDGIEDRATASMRASGARASAPERVLARAGWRARRRFCWWQREDDAGGGHRDGVEGAALGPGVGIDEGVLARCE